MGKSHQYVVRVGDRWGLRGQGNSRLTRLVDTQAEAIAAGRPIAMRNRSELRIQGRDGRFREAYSYGSDPYPPRG